jgi:hypothetical protein
MTHSEKLEAIWNAKHPDYRHVREDGTKVVLVLRKEGTCSVPLECLTDDEIERLLPKAKK